MLVIFSGCSGVGKNTLIQGLLEDKEKYEYFPSCTTRDMRPGEEEGNPYHFLREEEFLKMLDAGDFYEHETIHNHLYGTSKKILGEHMKSGRILLKDIDVNGALNLSRILKDDTKIITLFVTVDSVNELVRRLRKRGDKEEDIELRTHRFAEENAKMPYYGYTVYNNALEEAVEVCGRLIRFASEEKKVAPSRPFEELDRGLIKEYCEYLENNVFTEPIPILAGPDGWQVESENEKYAASLITGKNIVKLVKYSEKEVGTKEFTEEFYLRAREN